MLCRLFLLSALLFAAALPAAARGEEVKNYDWVWTDLELKKIEKLEKKIKEKDGFFEYEEEGFIVRSDISARFAAELSLYMESFVEAFPEVFPCPPRGTVLVKLTVTIYKEKSSYLASAPDIPQWSGGVFYPDWSKPGWPVWNVKSYPWNDENKEEFARFHRPVLQHEGAHAMFQKFTGRRPIPVFFNEGVATYFEWWNLREDMKTNRELRDKRTYRWRTLREKYSAEPDFKPVLKDYLDMPHEKWGMGGNEQITLNYALAESFMSFLLSSTKGRKDFKDMIGELYAGHALLEKDSDYRKLEKEWHKYINETLLPLAPLLYAIGTGENEAADRSFSIGYQVGKAVADGGEEKINPERFITGVMETLEAAEPKPDATTGKKTSSSSGAGGASKGKPGQTGEKANDPAAPDASRQLGVKVGEAILATGKERNLYYLERGLRDGVEGKTRAVTNQELMNTVMDKYRAEAEALIALLKPAQGS